jgi:predicted ATPase
VEAEWSAGSLRADQATRLWSLVPSTVTALVEGGPELLGTFVPGVPLIARAERHPGLQVGLLEDLRQLVDRSAAASTARQFDLFEQYVRVVRALAKECLLVLIVDDLQWADSGSVSLFFHLARELTGSRVLMLGLFRPSEVVLGRGGERHPFEPVLNEIKASFRDPEIRFGPTGDRQFVEALIDSEPNRLGPPFRASLFEQTRGHALFTVELLRGLEDQGLLVRDEEDRWMEHPDLEWDFLPARVEAVIEQRIGRLPLELQRILSIASVEGEEFTLEAVARAHGADTREILAPVSLELEKRHRLVTAVGFRRVDGQRLSVYRFRHILFQRYLYDHLDQVERALLHEQLGEALETLHGDHVDDIALQLARHFRAADMPEKAARYLRLAGERATRSGMFPEAIGHLEASLETLLSLPPSADRDRRELDPQMALGTARQLAYAPGQEAVFERARELAELLGDNHHLFWALMGLFGGRGYYGGDHRLAGS